MEVRNLEEAEPFTTKDGSTIRELLGLPTSSLVQKLSLAEATLGPGQATKRHYDRESEEIYFLLEGVGLMEVDGATRAGRPGDAVLVPAPVIPAHFLHTPSSMPRRPAEPLLAMFGSRGSGSVGARNDAGLRSAKMSRWPRRAGAQAPSTGLAKTRP